MLHRVTRLLRQVGMVTATTVVCLTAPAFAANLEFKPSLAISEEITDNIYQDPTNKRTEYTTRVQPGFASNYQSSLWRWDAEYRFDYLNFARNSGPDEYNHKGELKGNITVRDNFLYLDVSEKYAQIFTNIARDETTQGSLSIDQTKQNIAILSPYLLWHLSEKNTLKTGYRFTDTRYWGVGTDQSLHDVFADFSHEFTDKFSIFAGYNFAYEQWTSDHSTTHQANGGFRYIYADKSSIYGRIGNSWRNYSHGDSTTFLTWNMGIVHDFGITVATLETTSQTTADPLALSTTVTTYSAKLEKMLHRGAIAFSATYSEYANTGSSVTDQQKLALTGSGSYEVVKSLTPNFSVTAEHYYKQIRTGNTGINFPYHLSAKAGISYAFNYDITLNLNYKFDTYRNALDEATGSNEINLVVVEVKKVF